MEIIAFQSRNNFLFIRQFAIVAQFSALTRRGDMAGN